MDQNERISRAIQLSGKRKREVADECGVAPSAITQWINGETKALKAESVFALAKATGFRAEWLANGTGPEREGDIAAASPRLENNFSGNPIPVKTGSIPVVGKAMLSPEGYFEDVEYPVGFSMGFLNIYSSDPDAFGLRVVGNSMNPRIKNNEFVLVEPSKDYVAGDEVLVRTTKGLAMIKEFIYHRDGQYRLDSVNADSDPIFIHEDEVVDVQYVGAIVKSSRFTPAA
ncbi:LexA family transcriptional regulator [Metapseudomonas boanensis]|uniref:Helix-turn-helix transcriptional regulator n=1 Tax=Metapseudomonas boanensis TaxID=2822138 RepID=A0ABS5XG83_9GAMM|nr:S24 family peptidase [Pseudomonas boanensis]MBT8766708.1 helix-turn-helix transcriptional regulator [Pseudomonas boanensis]